METYSNDFKKTMLTNDEVKSLFEDLAKKANEKQIGYVLLPDIHGLKVIEVDAKSIENFLNIERFA